MLLVEFFCEIVNWELECDVIGFDGEVCKILLIYVWLGNVCEFCQKIMGVVLQVQMGFVMKEYLEFVVMRVILFVSFVLCSDVEDKECVLCVLKQVNGNCKVVVELFGIGCMMLYNKLEEYGLKYKFQ